MKSVPVMSIVPGDKVLCCLEGRLIVRQVATITMTTHLNEDGHYDHTTRDLGFHDSGVLEAYGVNDEVVKVNGHNPMHSGGFRYG